MSMRAVSVSLSATVVFTIAAGCQSSAKSSTKGGAISSMMPNKFVPDSNSIPPAVIGLREEDRYWAVVPKEQVAEYVTPADPAVHGIPKSMAGIWWTQGWWSQGLPTGPMVMTLANASWDPATRTAELAILGANSYAYENSTNNTATFGKVVKDGQPVVDPTEATYVIIFNETFDHVEIELEISDGNGGRAVDTAHSYTADLESDGTWTRHSSYGIVPLLDYKMIPLVDAKGQKTKQFASFIEGDPRTVAVVMDRNQTGNGKAGAAGGASRDDRGDTSDASDNDASSNSRAGSSTSDARHGAR